MIKVRILDHCGNFCPVSPVRLINQKRPSLNWIFEVSAARLELNPPPALRGGPATWS
jgi:hypothetical protein